MFNYILVSRLFPLVILAIAANRYGVTSFPLTPFSSASLHAFSIALLMIIPIDCVKIREKKKGINKFTD